MAADYRKKTNKQQQRYKEIIEKMEKTYEEGLESIISGANKKHDRMKEEKENARKQLEDFYKQKIKRKRIWNFCKQAINFKIVNGKNNAKRRQNNCCYCLSYYIWHNCSFCNQL
jgi:chemotaxis regulatin CheY-phosphate phosphatase CheZ